MLRNWLRRLCRWLGARFTPEPNVPCPKCGGRPFRIRDAVGSVRCVTHLDTCLFCEGRGTVSPKRRERSRKGNQ